MKTFFYSAMVAGAMAVAPLASADAATVVDVELSLLIDVSGSVDSTEFNLQRQGYINAFRNTGIHNLITSTANGREGSIAVNIIYWSTYAVESVAWTLIDSIDSANAFADTLENASRPSSSQVGTLTAPGTAINDAVASMNANDFDGTTRVIDVSGDGTQNSGANTAVARNAALAAGVDRINGIAIGDTSLETWYKNNIMGGDDAFVLRAATFGDFGDAIYQKLFHEIGGTNPTDPAPVPLPAAAWLLGGAVAGLGVMRRRQRS